MKKMKRPYGKAIRVYIAGPYRGDGKQSTVEKNIYEARKVAIRIARAGLFPVCPHLNTALFDFEDGLVGFDASFWLDNYKDLVLDCDAVLRMTGQSAGSDEEVKAAQKHGIPVYFTLNELLDDLCN
ncbi:MAG: protein of unknown function DUF1937 [Siphoviridae sp. ct7UA22]|nr:MAG: protein of unknown function DUF1937 [Siphoviridae sp. ct7UA22]